MSFILIGLIAIMIIGVFFFLIKRLFLMGVLLAVIYVLFHVAYIWSTQEVSENLKLDALFKEETVTKIEGAYDRFSERRNEHQVLELESLRDDMMDDLEDSISKNDLLEKWKSRFEGLNTKEIEGALKETSDIWRNVFTEEEMQ